MICQRFKRASGVSRDLLLKTLHLEQPDPVSNVWPPSLDALWCGHRLFYIFTADFFFLIESHSGFFPPMLQSLNNLSSFYFLKLVTRKLLLMTEKKILSLSKGCVSVPLLTLQTSIQLFISLFFLLLSLNRRVLSLQGSRAAPRSAAGRRLSPGLPSVRQHAHNSAAKRRLSYDYNRNVVEWQEWSRGQRAVPQLWPQDTQMTFLDLGGHLKTPAGWKERRSQLPQQLTTCFSAGVLLFLTSSVLISVRWILEWFSRWAVCTECVSLFKSRSSRFRRSVHTADIGAYYHTGSVFHEDSKASQYVCKLTC